jgi:hypothetical protein
MRWSRSSLADFGSVAGLAVVLAAVLVGCGGDGNSPTGDTDQDNTVSGIVSTPGAAKPPAFSLSDAQAVAKATDDGLLIGHVPLAGALVRVIDVRTGQPVHGVPDPACTTAADGAFTVAVPPGVLVRIEAEGQGAAGLTVHLWTLARLQDGERKTGEHIDAASTLAAALWEDTLGGLTRVAGTDAESLDLNLDTEGLKVAMRQNLPPAYPDFATVSTQQLVEAAVLAADGGAAPVPTTLVVVSVPAGARIFLDDADTGQHTPATLSRTQYQGLTPTSTHQLRLTLAGMADFGSWVQLAARPLTGVYAKLGAESGGGTAVGAAGGTVTSADGSAKLEIPAGALIVSTLITIRTADTATLDPAAVPGTVFEIGPAGTTFAKQAALAVTYDPERIPEGVDEADIRVGRLADGYWTSVPYSQHDATTNRVSVGVDGAGYYDARGITLQITPADGNMPPLSEQLVSVTYKPPGSVPGVSYHWMNNGFASHLKGNNGELVAELWTDANTNSVILVSTATPWVASVRCAVWSTVGSTQTCIDTVQNSLNVHYEPIRASVEAVDRTYKGGFSYAPQYNYYALAQFVWQHVPGITKYQLTLHTNGNNSGKLPDGFTFQADAVSVVLQPSDWWYEAGMAAWRPGQLQSGFIESAVLWDESDQAWAETKRDAKQQVIDDSAGWTCEIMPVQ